MQGKILAACAHVLVVFIAIAYYAPDRFRSNYCDYSVSMQFPETTAFKYPLLYGAETGHSTESFLRKLLTTKANGVAVPEESVDQFYATFPFTSTTQCGFQLQSDEPCTVAAIYYWVRCLEELDEVATVQTEHPELLRKIITHLSDLKDVVGGFKQTNDSAPSLYTTLQAMHIATTLLEEAGGVTSTETSGLLSALHGNIDLMIAVCGVWEGGVVDTPSETAEEYTSKRASTAATARAMHLLLNAGLTNTPEMASIYQEMRHYLTGCCTKNGVTGTFLGPVDTEAGLAVIELLKAYPELGSSVSPHIGPSLLAAAVVITMGLLLWIAQTRVKAVTSTETQRKQRTFVVWMTVFRVFLFILLAVVLVWSAPSVFANVRSYLILVLCDSIGSLVVSFASSYVKDEAIPALHSKSVYLSWAVDSIALWLVILFLGDISTTLRFAMLHGTVLSWFIFVPALHLVCSQFFSTMAVVLYRSDSAKTTPTVAVGGKLPKSLEKIRKKVADAAKAKTAEGDAD